MNRESTPIREKIILAAINCIERDGIHGVTNRGIAREAGVNSAAVNYYFGSKENLLDIALKATLREGFVNPLEELGLRQKDFSSAMEDILSFLADGTVKFPGITKAHLYDPLMNGKYDVEFVKEVRQFMEYLFDLAKSHHPEWNDEDIRLSLAEVWSSIVLMGVLPEFYRQVLHLDIQDPQVRKRFVKHLASRHFPGR